MSKSIALGLILISICCTAVAKDKTEPAKQRAAAVMKKGEDTAGSARFSQIGADVKMQVTLTGLAAGEYGMHLHQIGKCDPPDYKSAGPHWNPGARLHGLNNPKGAHAGDLPNLISVGGKKPSRLTYNLTGVKLTGEGGLFDADGAALVIHAKADDGLTDPSGNSGDRIICGVLTLKN